MLNTRRLTLDDVLNYRFFQMPMFLFEGDLKQGLSSEAKILYSLLIERQNLSLENNWFNENNLVYIIFTREEMADMLSCSLNTLRKALDQLKKFNLIEDEHIGLNKPNRIYIKKFGFSR